MKAADASWMDRVRHCPTLFHWTPAIQGSASCQGICLLSTSCIQMLMGGAGEAFQSLRDCTINRHLKMFALDRCFLTSGSCNFSSFWTGPFAIMFLIFLCGELWFIIWPWLPSPSSRLLPRMKQSSSLETQPLKKKKKPTVHIPHDCLRLVASSEFLRLSQQILGPTLLLQTSTLNPVNSSCASSFLWFTLPSNIDSSPLFYPRRQKTLTKLI